MQGGKEKTGTGAPVHFFFILSVITEHLKAGLLERERANRNGAEERISAMWRKLHKVKKYSTH